MTLFFPSAEFDDTVAAVCHGAAGEEQMRGLNELLWSDAGARDEYLLRVEVHARLASERDLFPQAADAAAVGGPAEANPGERRNILHPKLRA